MEMSLDYVYLLFYHYSFIPDPTATCDEQTEFCRQHELNGRIRVASEGINGTIAGSQEQIHAYIAFMDQWAETLPHAASSPKIHWKFSHMVDRFSPEKQKLKSLSVKVTKEVVSLDLPPDVREAVLSAPPAVHLSPLEFHQHLLSLTTTTTSKTTLAEHCETVPSAHTEAVSEPSTSCIDSCSQDFALLDIRNHYEVQVGTFFLPGPSGEMIPATNPQTRAFSDIVRYFDDHIDDLKGKKVYMYCTGGVRCERASAYLRYKGVDEIYQLYGGIHNYQDTVSAETSLFRGRNFVFDPRISLPNQTHPPFNKDGCDLAPSPLSTESTTGDSVDCIGVVGRCQACSVSFDDFSPQIRCSSCRMLVLVCFDCCEKSDILEAIRCDICTRRDG